MAKLHSSRRPEPVLFELGQLTMSALDSTPLHARIDLVRMGGDRFTVMELELTEPSLYLRMDPVAPDRFADAFHSWKGDPSGKEPR